MTGTVGVLLPLRIETRFDGDRLRLRVIPDEPWLDRHDPLPHAGELDLLERYAAAGGSRPAWRALAAQVGGGRAGWLVDAFLRGLPDGTLRVDRPSVLRETARLPEIPFFPAHLQVWLVLDGSAPRPALTLDVKSERLRAGLPDPDDTDDHRWWESWTEAVAAGLAGEIDLSHFPGRIDTLYVTGIGTDDTEPARLFAAHADSGRIALLRPGDPTNTVDGTPAADLGDDPDRWLDARSAPETPTSRAVSAALTGSENAFRALLDDDPDHASRSGALVAGLWPALWGFAQTSVWSLARPEEVAAWAAGNLVPEGPWPPLRIGDQPYGLLPATALNDWLPAAGDPPFEPDLIAALRVLRDRWAEAARERTVQDADTGGLLDRLAQVPTSTGYRHRDARPLQLWFLAMLYLGYSEDWIDALTGWRDAGELAENLGLNPHRRYASVGGSIPVTLPLITPADLASGDTTGAMLHRVLQVISTDPALLAQPDRLLTEILETPASSLLLRLAIRALQVAVGEIGRARTQDLSWLDPLLRRSTDQPPLERWIRSVSPADLTAATPAARQLAQVRTALDAVAGLADTDPSRLESLLRATIDTSTYRIDPWLAAPALRRLRDLGKGGARWLLGAYGWVDSPRTGNPGPTGGGLLHAPSQPQATTAMILRDRAINDTQPRRWHMNLTSGTVRAADRLAAAVRGGLHLTEALGLEVERIAGDPVAVLRLRRDFPIRDEHAGRRVCDGQAVLAAPPSDLGLSGKALAGLAGLRAAVDAYGDLLVAQAVYDVVEGRGESAGATMDAAAGLARPPDLSVLRTRRAGRTVSTTCLVVLPTPPEVSFPDDPEALSEVSPATVADPAFAAFLTATFGPATAWTWLVTGGATVTLADLGLAPVDALAVPLDTLETLVAEVGHGEIVKRSGSTLHARAVRLAALIGCTPPDGELLAQRYQNVRTVAQALIARLRDGTAGEQPARRWGVTPSDGADLLAKRLAAAPADPAGMDPAEQLRALTDLVTPTGRLAVLGRVRRDQLPADLVPAPGLDEEWLTVAAAVREPLARLEAHQLAAGTHTATGDAFTAWSSRPGDPWQLDPAGDPLTAAYAPAGLFLDTLADDDEVAVGVLDRFGETIPAAEGTTSAVFGFNAPTARAPQTILVAVPPDPDQPLNPAALVSIVAETRQLAQARMARPADLVSARALSPCALLPAEGPTAVPLDTETA